MAVVAHLTTNREVESLRELKGLLGTVNDQVSAHERDDCVVETWLRVKSDDLVLHGGELIKLFHDGGGTEELFTLVGEHRLSRVEGTEVGTL